MIFDKSTARKSITISLTKINNLLDYRNHEFMSKDGDIFFTNFLATLLVATQVAELPNNYIFELSQV
jgi:hypothetical protein